MSLFYSFENCQVPLLLSVHNCQLITLRLTYAQKAIRTALHVEIFVVDINIY
jgi:hypothetical protein